METNGKRKFDLEERVIDYAVLIIQITDNMIDTRAGNFREKHCNCPGEFTERTKEKENQQSYNAKS